MLVHERQEQSNWCWAACLRMAASSFAVAAPQQCVLATQFLTGAAGCCANGASGPCNVPLDARRIPALYSAVKLVADALGAQNGTLSEATVRAALGHGLALLMLDLGSAFHFVLVEGASGATYQIADPNYDGTVTAGWDDVSTAYGNGSIAQAWRVYRR